MFLTRNFGYDKVTRTFAAEASSLIGALAAGGRLYAPLYDDAADQALRLHSCKTGACATFVLEEVKEHDGDLISWTFIPLPAEVRRNPGLAGSKIVVFND